jgi:hypothetical protein
MFNRIIFLAIIIVINISGIVIAGSKKNSFVLLDKTTQVPIEGVAFKCDIVNGISDSRGMIKLNMNT